MLKNYIELSGKKYAYSIIPLDSDSSRIVCRDAKIDQEFLNEDIVGLLTDLPDLIRAEQKYQQKQDSVIRFRISALEKVKLQKKLKSEGYTTISAYIKDKIL